MQIPDSTISRHATGTANAGSIHSKYSGAEVVSDVAMADALHEYFNNIMGVNFERSKSLNLAEIGVPTEDLSALEAIFTEDEM